MKKKIDNPKVFISYAWGSKEYQNKVLSFSSQLVSDGIDVVLDKWDLNEGNDTYAFMEMCVTDETITNVLMLLDPLYAQRADEHAGGVGTETQIISAKVYKEVTQEKFIPIIMERNEYGEVCKPTYLQGRLHFDLSNPDVYDETYQRLVKTLYGEEIYAKPQLGKKPDWVKNPTALITKSIVTYEALKNIQSEKVKKEKFIDYLNDIFKRIERFGDNKETSISFERYVDLYDSLHEIKNDFLLLVRNSIYVKGCQKNIAHFFEEIINTLPINGGLTVEIVKVFVHEVFIYTIAHFLKIQDYHAVGYILGKTYFNQSSYRNDLNAEGFNIFHSGREHSNLDRAVCGKDGNNYYSGTAQHWISNLNTEFCSKEQFVLADLICYNYSIYGKYYISKWRWFPITYVYDNEYRSTLGMMARRMSSKEYLEELVLAFGYDNINEFIEKFKTVETIPETDKREYRYSTAFSSANILGDFIKSDQLASLR